MPADRSMLSPTCPAKLHAHRLQQHVRNLMKKPWLTPEGSVLLLAELSDSPRCHGYRVSGVGWRSRERSVSGSVSDKNSTVQLPFHRQLQPAA